MSDPTAEQARLVEHSALELSGLIHRREVSCVDVMTAYLAQIERYNPVLNAIVALRDREELLAEARQRDDELAAGHSRGWMHGFPHAVKDLAAARGLPHTSGSRIFADRVAEADDRRRRPHPGGRRRHHRQVQHARVRPRVPDLQRGVGHHRKSL